MKRGDIVLARFPHPSGARGKKRPLVIVQADKYSHALQSVIVAEVTSNLDMANDPGCLFIDISTPDGQATGLIGDSVVSCLLLATIYSRHIDQVIGRLSDRMIHQLDGCLKTALGVP